eukprot:TRINITY_DN958_c0_g1_i2.p1 TRINITY_DN958_c0_g1~~TRINITY_DN958_c0_g1_i2.p1  ORF type:complete len:387 (-),score=105.17 TRINITY_DN958_c0_g1_i2:240-1400(-)
MEKADKVLFTEFKAGELFMKNRIVMGALTRARCVGRMVSDVNVQYYSQRSGAGMIITEAASISEGANGMNDTPGMYLPAHVSGWRKLTDALHKEGCTAVAQLWHTGRMSHSSFHGGKQIVGPSSIGIDGGNGVQDVDGVEQAHEVPRELSTEECESIVDDFARAAQLAKEAGFDGVEIHSATGYLIDTFLQSCSNRRADKYGGDFEGRFTFLKEVLEKVCEIFPNRVGVKISPDSGFNGMGSADNHEMFKHVAQRLNDFDLAYLHVMDGIGPDAKMKWWGKMTSDGFHGLCPPLELADLRPLFKKALIGNVNYTADTANGRIQEGNADAISFGRPFFANPDLPHRFLHGLELSALPEPTAWFHPSDKTREDPHWGYTDFPAAAMGA